MMNFNNRNNLKTGQLIGNSTLRFGLKGAIIGATLVINVLCVLMFMDLYTLPVLRTIGGTSCFILAGIVITYFAAMPIGLLGGIIPANHEGASLYQQLTARRTYRKRFWCIACAILSACVIISIIVRSVFGTTDAKISYIDQVLLLVAYYFVILLFGFVAIPTSDLKECIEAEPPSWYTVIDLAAWAAELNDWYIMSNRLEKLTSRLLPSLANEAPTQRGEIMIAAIRYIEVICQEPLMERTLRQDFGDYLVRCFSRPVVNDYSWFADDMPAEEFKLCREYVTADDIRRGEIARQLNPEQLQSLIRYTAERKRYDEEHEFMDELARTVRKTFLSYGYTVGAEQEE